MRRVIVVGASGLLGGRMRDVYGADYEVFGTYNSRGAETDSLRMLDVTRGADVARLVGELSPDVIIDAHGLTSIDYCEANKEEATRINVDGTRNIAESAKECGATVVFISTDAVFDGMKGSPYTEEDATHPLNHYGATKAMAERAVASSGADYIIARTSVLFGKGIARKPPTFTTWAIEQLGQGRSITVVTDQYNNPTYIDSLAEFVRRLWERGERGIFHTAGRETISRFDFAKRIAAEFGFDGDLVLPITTAELKQSVTRALWLGLDISKAEKAASMKGLMIDKALAEFRRAR